MATDSTALTARTDFGTCLYREDCERSPAMTFSNGQSRVERTFIAEWDKLDVFVAAILGYPKLKAEPEHLASSANDTRYLKRAHYISRVVPDSLKWPQSAGSRLSKDEVDDGELDKSATWLFASGIVRIDPLEPKGSISSTTGMPSYNWARVVVAYEPLTYKIRSDDDLMKGIGPDAVIRDYVWEKGPVEFWLRRYVTKTVRPTVEYIALPRGSKKWVVTDASLRTNLGTTVSYASAVLTPSTEIVYTWHQVPFFPQAVKHHIGSVNLYPFKDHNTLYPAGTLLLLGCEIKPYRMASGKFVLDIMYRIKHFDPFRDGRGHNHFLHYSNKLDANGENGMVFLKITSNGNTDIAGLTDARINALAGGPGVPVFPYADFQELFAFKCATSRDRKNPIPKNHLNQVPESFNYDVDPNAVVPKPSDAL